MLVKLIYLILGSIFSGSIYVLKPIVLMLQILEKTHDIKKSKNVNIFDLCMMKAFLRVRQSKSEWMRIEFETFFGVGPHKTSASAWTVETTWRQSYKINLSPNK